MQNTIAFCQQHSKKSLMSLKVRNMTLKRLEKLAKLQVTSRHQGRVCYEELDLSIFRDSSLPNLGPGSYNTPHPAPTQAPSFGYASRFKLSPCKFTPIQSANLIKQNKKMIVHTPEYRQKKLEATISQKRLKECINRETKKIIHSEKIVKFQDSLNEKFNKTETNKIKAVKKQIALVYSQMLLVFCSAQETRKKIELRKDYKIKIKKYLMGFAVFCKAVGKFKMFIKRAKIILAYRVITKYVPRFLKKMYAFRKEKYLKILVEALENFSKNVGISRINYMIDCKIRVIQRAYRKFSFVNQYRKHALRIMWDKLDRKCGKVNEKIKHYYISSYLTQRFEDFIQQKNEMDKQYTIFITTDLEHLRKSGELKKRGNIELPFFRIFIEKYVKKLIVKAWNDKEKWQGINYLNFPIKLEKEKRRTNATVSPIIKKRKALMKQKRGTVTFKLNN